MNRTVDEIIQQDIIPAIKQSPRDNITKWVALISSIISILVIIFAMFKPFFEMEKDRKAFQDSIEKRVKIIEIVNWQTHPEYQWMMTNPSNIRGIDYIQSICTPTETKEKSKL